MVQSEKEIPVDFSSYSNNQPNQFQSNALQQVYVRNAQQNLNIINEEQEEDTVNCNTSNATPMLNTYHYPCFNYACMPPNYNCNFQNSCPHNVQQHPCCYHATYAYQPQCTNHMSIGAHDVPNQQSESQDINQNSDKEIIENQVTNEPNTESPNSPRQLSEKISTPNNYSYFNHPIQCPAHCVCPVGVFPQCCTNQIPTTFHEQHSNQEVSTDQSEKIENSTELPTQIIPPTAQIPLCQVNHCHALPPPPPYTNCCMHRPYDMQPQRNYPNAYVSATSSPSVAKSVSNASISPQTVLEPFYIQNSNTRNGLEISSPRTPRTTPRQLLKITTSVSEIIPPFNTNTVKSPRMLQDDSNEDVIIRNSIRQLTLQHECQKEFHRQFQKEYAQGFYNKRCNGLDADSNRKAIKNKLILNPAEPCNSSKMNLVNILVYIIAL